MLGTTRRLALVLALGLFAAPAIAQVQTPGVPPRADLPETAKAPSFSSRAYRLGVVSTANPHATEAAARILERGGNAIDAAVTAVFVLNLVEPQSSGIGGGGFMMIHVAKTGETVVVDSREKAPAAARPDMFVGVPSPTTHGISVGVPGMVRGVELALTRYGSMSLAETLAPAIDLAENGFAVTSRLAAQSCGSRATNYPETAALYCPGGLPLAVGQTFKNPGLAKTFRILAADGADAFYTGPIAQAIVEAQRRFRTGGRGGEMTLEDLASYEADLREPTVVDYRGYTFKSMPSPSSGGLTVSQMLKMLERFPIGGDPNEQGWGFGGTKTLHVMIEAMRLAYADRAIWMGDDDFVRVPKIGLLHPDYIALRGALINGNTRQSSVSAGQPFDFEANAPAGRYHAGVEPAQPVEHGTTHLSVVDRWGNVVSYTNTVESGFGAGMIPGAKINADGTLDPGYGFVLNNELTDFNTTPTRNEATGNPGTNDVAPGKRPRSSMTPSMLFVRGRPVAAFGSPSGATIINAVLNVTLNLVDHGMEVQEAIDAPRVSSTGGTVSYERRPGKPQFAPETISALAALGHTLSPTSDIGSVQMVVIDLQTGKQYGGADDRRDGTVIGLPRGGAD